MCDVPFSMTDHLDALNAGLLDLHPGRWLA
jgi:hypothetical protein